jgi:hypothetical protein
MALRVGLLRAQWIFGFWIANVIFFERDQLIMGYFNNFDNEFLNKYNFFSKNEIFFIDVFFIYGLRVIQILFYFIIV